MDKPDYAGFVIESAKSDCGDHGDLVRTMYYAEECKKANDEQYARASIDEEETKLTVQYFSDNKCKTELTEARQVFTCEKCVKSIYDTSLNMYVECGSVAVSVVLALCVVLLF